MRITSLLLLALLLLAIAAPLAADTVTLLAQGKNASARPAAKTNDLPAKNETVKSEAAKGDAAKSEASKSDGQKSRGTIGFTPEREAAAIIFVQQHHPELEQLLTYLKANHTKDYQRAIRDLFRACERLAQVQEEEPREYELELAAWKIKSRIQLIRARLKVSPDSAPLQAELRAAILAQLDLRVEVLKHERTLLNERLEKLDVRIERMQANREQQAERMLDMILSGEPKPRSKPTEKD